MASNEASKDGAAGEQLPLPLYLPRDGGKGAGQPLQRNRWTAKGHGQPAKNELGVRQALRLKLTAMRMLYKAIRMVEDAEMSEAGL